MNPLSARLLALLALTEDGVGRFRDAYVTETHEGQHLIAIYTRNGGGNRDCWHSDGGGSQGCGGETYEVEVDEYEPPQKAGGILIYSGKKTGRRIMDRRWRCPEPGSRRCACPGCVIEHRLPLHPGYVSDKDDDFDCTFATIYFRVPDAARDIVAMLCDKQADTPQERMRAIMNKLTHADQNDPDVTRALAFGRPIIEQITAALKTDGSA